MPDKKDYFDRINYVYNTFIILFLYKTFILLIYYILVILGLSFTNYNFKVVLKVYKFLNIL